MISVGVDPGKKGGFAVIYYDLSVIRFRTDVDTKKTEWVVKIPDDSVIS